MYSMWPSVLFSFTLWIHCISFNSQEHSVPFLVAYSNSWKCSASHQWNTKPVWIINRYLRSRLILCHTSCWRIVPFFVFHSVPPPALNLLLSLTFIEVTSCAQKKKKKKTDCKTEITNKTHFFTRTNRLDVSLLCLLVHT